MAKIIKIDSTKAWKQQKQQRLVAAKRRWRQAAELRRQLAAKAV